MSELLDTCTWLRVVGRLSELNPESRTLLANPAGAPFHLAAISIWEVTTKFRKKPAELSLNMPVDDWLEIALQPRFIHVIPLDAGIARLSNALPGEFHEDPADRIIVATAIREGLRVITSDLKILAYPHVPSLDTR